MSRVLVAVNSTEWRNLCARGSIRLMRNRPVIGDSVAAAMPTAALFAVAPTTKIDSSVDVLVLSIRSDWPNETSMHHAHPDLFLLRLEDVHSHHVVAQEHLGYYRVEAAKTGVEVSDVLFDVEWREWSTSEMAAAAVDSASALLSHLGLPALSGDKSAEGLRWRDVAGLVVGSDLPLPISDTAVECLIRKALPIEDAAAAVRGSEAFSIACCIEWIDHRVGADALEHRPVGSLLRSTLVNLRKVDRSLGASISAETQAALDLLEAAFPAAFTTEVSPSTVAPIVSLIAEARTGAPGATEVYRMLRFLSRNSPESLPLTCVLVAAAIGPELVRQLMRSTRSVRS